MVELCQHKIISIVLIQRTHCFEVTKSTVVKTTQEKTERERGGEREADTHTNSEKEMALAKLRGIPPKVAAKSRGYFPLAGG